MRIKIIYKIFDHFFLYFLSNFKIFLFDAIPKIKKIWQLYKPEKNFPQKSHRILLKKDRKKGNFSIIVCQEKLCDYAIKSQKFCAEEQKEALHQRANGIYNTYVCIYTYVYMRLVIQCRTNIWPWSSEYYNQKAIGKK